jgi:hypothetical protein
MTSLETFYQSELLPDLEKLEAQRINVKKKLIQAVLIVLGLNLVFLFVAGLFGLNLTFLFLFLVLSAIFTLFPWHVKYYRDYHAGFKAAIIPRIVAFVHQGLRYDKDGWVSKEEFLASHLFHDRLGEYKGDDLVSGTIGETAIKFSEIHAKRVDIVRQGSSSSSANRGTKKRYIPIFSGLFFVADFNKAFKGTTVVLPDTAQKLFGDMGQALQALNVQNGQLIKLEDPEFEKLFVVYGEDQVEARYLLSTSLMRRIVDFRNRTRKEMRLSFSASKLHVAIPLARELFEPKIMESLLTIAHVQEYYDDLKLAIDIVEDLNLNTRIWTTKSQAAPDSVAAANAAIATGPSATETAPPPPPAAEAAGRLSPEDAKKVFREFVDKADTAFMPKVKRWGKRIGGAILLLGCLPALLFEAYMAALIIFCFGVFFLIGGFASPYVEKVAFTVLFIAVGLIIALFTYNAYATRMASKTWPTANGVIIQSEIEEHTRTSSDDPEKEETFISTPKIVYEYRVDGNRFKGTQIALSSPSGNPQQLVARYPKGKSLPVYYNPDKPQQAVLVPGGPGFNTVPYFFAGTFLLFGILSAVHLWKRGPHR